ncbi:RNA polymerase sigma factor [Sciscionella sediminilitoris]|uniref:RNA polymerase sigma factor n=1 Tax=Sciscionella sediminilitoris TaxID=1445613 RepID=UPI0018D002D2|nr:sigma-70 family RNA polymerase sigma factor [Sciscionella sp. SE31]
MHLEDFYAAHRRKVYNVIARRVEAGAVEDLFSQAWMTFLERWERYREYDNPEAPLMKIVRTTCKDWYRRRSSKVVEIPLDDQALRAIPLPLPADVEPDTFIDLHTAISRLPTRQREALILKYIDDLQRDTVAELMGITVNGVKKLLSAAMRTLRTDPAITGDSERLGAPK